MQNIVLGLIIFAVGALITLGLMAISEETDISVVAYGAMGWGVLQVLYGIGRVGCGALKPAGEKAKEQQDSETFAFIHCMIAMAAADGKIQEGEMNRVRELFQKVMNMNVSEYDVRKVADQYNDGTRSWREAIDFNARKMSPERRSTLYRACVMIASADGELAEKERARLHELAKHVGVTPQDEERVLNETLAMLKAQISTALNRAAAR